MTEVRGFKSYFDAAKARVSRIDSDAVAQTEAESSDVVLLDVRQAQEYAEGALLNAVHIPRGLLEGAIESRVPDKHARIIIYCASGVRSVMAAQTLGDLDYDNVVSLNGGFNHWKDEGRPWEVPVLEKPADQYYTQQFLPADRGD